MSTGVKHLTILEFTDLVRCMTGPNRTRNRALAVMNASTGFRISELLSLKVKDVWHKGRLKPRILVPKRNMKKKREGRSVVMSEVCKKFLIPWLTQMRKDGNLKPETPLFYYVKTDPIHWADKTVYRDTLVPLSRFSAWKIYNRAAELAGISGRIGTHSLRKLFGNEGYILSGRDIHQAANLLGQKDPASTRHYLPSEQESIDNLVQNISQSLLSALDF